ncbi:hypothetical protein THASP1DRAFT_18871 [Thamnocephalis sphaerospora]|uniref:DUF1748-domain-containing protein n=1 Tax=Thamnocephalis sphaerospora TaxID=78915 RepID=A0A4P9XK09_9FUNG|nr:hypothetical protein THASP1DRAFT_18871 [Thamnocephalis sphaerospora]|eukprot:RKP06127.1 hypothetical protein THASP1DRAFT_18871 [Thamnocephalis sphaerospora]
MEFALLAISLLRPYGMLGRIVHYAVDAVLVSATLAGIRRSTGISFNTEEIKSEDMRKYTQKYLDLGEFIVDQSVAFMGTSNYFKRSRD